MNRLIVLIDWENIINGIREVIHVPEQFSLEAGFEKLVQWLKGIDSDYKVFVFAPQHIYYGEAFQLFHKFGFISIICPKIGIERKDTTDAILIEFGNWLLGIGSPTYFCLGSVDRHFKEGFIDRMKTNDTKIAIICGNPFLTDTVVAKTADTHPKSGERMIHVFSPMRNE